MQFKLFSIAAAGDAESEELNCCLRSNRAVSVEQELVQGGHTAYWCSCVEYLPSGRAEIKGGGRPRVDYKEILSADDFAPFARESPKGLANPH
jgi:hypothetical protein